MPTLSSHYAVVTLPNGDEIQPISIDVTADETWSPYIQANIVVPSSFITSDIDPRNGSRIKFRLQQDFGDLVYIHELTAAFGGSVSAVTAAYTPVKALDITGDFTAPWNIFEPGLPLSTVTAAYTPVTPLKLTNADLANVWKMSDFLHSSGTFNPYPSTLFTADLGVRSIAFDYVSKQATIRLASDEALAQDVFGYGDDIMFEYDSIRPLIQKALNMIDATLQDGTADFAYSPPYQLQKYELNLDKSVWDFLETITTAAGLKIYCDELRNWYLVDPVATSGTLQLKDTDNITSFTREISRDGLFYNQAAILYDTTDLGLIWDNYKAPGTQPTKTLYQFKNNLSFPGFGGAQSIVERSLTRGETYNIEAVANFDGRPRQTLTIDITGETTKTGIIQSVSWSLPSARMSIDIRDLTEV